MCVCTMHYYLPTFTSVLIDTERKINSILCKFNKKIVTNWTWNSNHFFKVINKLVFQDCLKNVRNIIFLSFLFHFYVSKCVCVRLYYFLRVDIHTHMSLTHPTPFLWMISFTLHNKHKLSYSLHFYFIQIYNK